MNYLNRALQKLKRKSQGGMLEYAENIVVEAEELARDGANLAAVYRKLRTLSLDDFGQLMWSMPDSKYPALSSMLPGMADESAQKRFTGATGLELLKRTLSFIRQMETNAVRYGGSYPRDSSILDFGVGYGRMVRLLYYYTNPENIWGLDPQQDALNYCTAAGLQGNFRLSSPIPRSLPVDGTQFDLAYAFSVFTHLSPESAEASLAAVRDVMKPGGLFLATVWPPEIWTYFDQRNGTKLAPSLIGWHKEAGFAYTPHAGDWGKTYGNATVSFDFFEGKGWQVLGYDSTLADVFQITVILRKS